jgi:DNA (cytosine-5)-methyltransferase 1
MNKVYINTFTFVDLFAGIGGFRIPLEEFGGNCVGFSEIDKTAIETYKKNFNTNDELELGDISVIKNIPEVDLVVGGVPCQSWSVAGKKKGFDDPRGKLWFDTINFVKSSNPKAFIFENVKGLADPRNKENLELIIKSLEDLGYNCQYKVLNTFDYGLPQNRERIFIVGIRSDLKFKFQYPEKYPFLPNLCNILENSNNIVADEIETDNLKNAFNLSYMVNQANFYTFCDTRNGNNNIHSWDIKNCSDKEIEICLALLKNRRKKIYGDKDGNPLSYLDLKTILGNIDSEDLDSLIDKKILRKNGNKYDFVNSKNSAGINDIYRVFLPTSHVFSTLTKTGTKDYISDLSIPIEVKDKKSFFINEIYMKKMFRKISVLEASRIQGFPDNYIYPDNYNKSLALLGNALGVNIVREVVKELLPVFTSYNQKKIIRNNTIKQNVVIV